MPHGLPDWGLIGPISVLYGLDDMAEQAVRLGAVASWDRIGHVIFSDNFREGLGAWTMEGSDATAVTCLFTGHALSSPYCVKLRNGSAGARYARMRHRLSYVYRGHCALECNVTLEPGTEYIKFGVSGSTPTSRLFFYVRLTPTTGVLAWGTDGAGWTPFATLGWVGWNVDEWHNVKLVADIETGYFIRFVWEGTAVDMSAIAGVALATAKPYNWMVYIENDADTAAQHSVYVDDVIVTIDVP